MKAPVHERLPGSVVEGRISDLERRVSFAIQETPHTDWGAIWREIRDIGYAFGQTWFSSGEARGAAWGRFQQVVKRVKREQEDALNRARVSHNHTTDSRHAAKDIIELAEKAWPHADGFMEFLGTITGAKIFAEVIVAFIELGVRMMSFGLLKAEHVHEQSVHLKQCSEDLREAWALYKEHRDLFLFEDRDVIRRVLIRVQSELDAAWTTFKSERVETAAERARRKQELILRASALRQDDLQLAGQQCKELHAEWKGIGFVGDKQHEHDLWDAFSTTIKAFWDEVNNERNLRRDRAIDSLRSNIHKLRQSIEHDEGVLQDKQGKLEDIYEGPRADEIREGLTNAIQSLNEKIERKEAWICEQEDRIERILNEE
jgi:hypothetical protein